MGQTLDKPGAQQHSDQEDLNDDAFLSRIPSHNRIERVRGISHEEFERKYYIPNKPVILTDVVTSWPAYQKWTTDYLDQKIGGFKHTFRYGKNSIQMKVSDYIEKAKLYVASEDKTQKFFPDVPDAAEKLPYIRHFGPLQKNAPELYQDINPDSLFVDPKKIFTQSFLFMGVPETKTNIHFDTSSNFVAIVSGTKHIALFPPGAEQHFNLSDKDKGNLVCSEAVPTPDPANLQLDSRKEDTGDTILMHEHEVFKDTPTMFYSPLRAGEMVLIPNGWYHYIHNVDFSVSVTIQTLKLP